MFTTLTGEKLQKTSIVHGIGAFGVASETVSKVPRLDLAIIKTLLTETTITGSCAACEIDISNFVKDHPGCVQMIDVATREKSVLTSPRLSDLHEGLVADDFYPIYEKGSSSLHDALEKDFSLEELRKLMHQMASGVHYLHAKGVIHRDIKSNNFIYFPNHVVKICDFGTCKKYHPSESSTPRLSHPLFRAPEIFLNLNYDFKVDVWSLGCLFIYMLTKQYMFLELMNETDDNVVLNGIIHLLPYNIDIETYETMIKGNRHFHLSSNSGPIFRKSWSEVIKTTDESLISLINSMMQFNPNRRISMQEVLSSPFFFSCTPIPFPQQKSKNFYLKVNCCLERAQFIMKLFPMHVTLANYTWYNPRILFFALDLFDRLLFFMSKDNIENNPVTYYSSRLKTDGNIFARKSVSLFVYASAYFALKYFYRNKIQIEWSDFSYQKFDVEAYLKFEKSLFFVTSCSFYRLNLYESFSDLTNDQIKSLMRFIISTTCNNEKFYSYRDRARNEIFNQ